MGCCRYERYLSLWSYRFILRGSSSSLNMRKTFALISMIHGHGTTFCPKSEERGADELLALIAAETDCITETRPLIGQFGPAFGPSHSSFACGSTLPCNAGAMTMAKSSSRPPRRHPPNYKPPRGSLTKGVHGTANPCAMGVFRRVADIYYHHAMRESHPQDMLAIFTQYTTCPQCNRKARGSVRALGGRVY